MKKTVKQQLTNEQRNARLRAFLKDHDMTNIAKLCRRIPYNRGGFGHFMEGTLNLSDEVIEKAETLLLPYDGFSQLK